MLAARHDDDGIYNSMVVYLRSLVSCRRYTTIICQGKKIYIYIQLGVSTFETNDHLAIYKKCVCVLRNRTYLKCKKTNIYIYIYIYIYCVRSLPKALQILNNSVLTFSLSKKPMIKVL